MTDQALTTTEAEPKAIAVKRNEALLKAIGFDKLAPEQRELGLNIAKRYELDLLLKHLVIIEGRVYITRDGLLHVAHRSNKLDGIEVTEPVIREGFWRSTCSVYRKDMSRPFTYPGRYPTSGGNSKYAQEMAIKVGEVMALRRAFDVSAPAAEERWADVPEPSESAAVPTLAERVAKKAAEVKVEPVQTHEAIAAPLNGIEVTAGETAVIEAVCGATSDPRLGPVDVCSLPAGHPGSHIADNGATWTPGKPAGEK